VWLPLILNHCYFKGTASINSAAAEGSLWYTNLLTMGVCAGYEWNHVYTPTHPAYSRPWEVINDVRSTLSGTTPVTWDIGINYNCPGAGWRDRTTAGQVALRACVDTVARTRAGLYWLIWNEPDDGGQDNFSPAQGAQFFREISDTILSADPTARLVVGNVLNAYRGTDPEHGCPDPLNAAWYGCGVHWLTQFISAAQALGYDPTPVVAGFGFHAYSIVGYQPPSGCDLRFKEFTCHDEPLLANFTNSVITAINWVAVHAPGKEIWLTEINWHPFDDTNWDVQTRRMTQICSVVSSLPIQRYFWYYGGTPYTTTVITSSLFAESPPAQEGALSPAGQQFALPLASGGCPR
jgi:hypothetical protein